MTTALKAFDAKELTALKQAATDAYKNRQHGYDAFAETDPRTGRAIGKMMIGAYAPELVLTAEQIIPTYLAKIADGHTLHELGTIKHAGSSHYIYFYKPEAQQRADLKVIHAEIEARYRASIESHNTNAYETLMAARLEELERQDELERIQEAAAARAKRRAELEAQVEAELAGTTGKSK
ncbi:hypothetical protein HTV13_07425 [Pseudomonas putida]|uniref:hypothetical protein n=1 Tax=Pseudomonas putida TaxID=303 RepID=UPI0015718BFB|nr:hypothetical protein [Pseudomonas putida]NSX19660.1 hypothetical protein [Pseudomonas putida]